MNANAHHRYDTANGRLRHSLVKSLDAALFVLLSALLTLAAATSFVEDAARSAAFDGTAAKPAATVLAAHKLPAAAVRKAVGR